MPIDTLADGLDFQGFLEAAPDGIVVVDADGRILVVNTQTEKMFGYPRSELLGHTMELLVPERFRGAHASHRRDYLAEPVTRPMGASRHLTGRRRDGTEFPLEVSLSPLGTARGTLVTSILRDITDRRLAEARLEASLREKEALLREIHHRVKNNLQITSSLLRLQAHQIDDPRVREQLAESQRRIHSMALVHEKLYQSADLSRIDLAEYLRSLGDLLYRALGAGAVRLVVTACERPVFLAVDNAVPCGLIVNELLTNALKHGFPAGQAGCIEVDLREQDGRVTIRVADDGVGLPQGYDTANPRSLGLQLVRALVRQVDGELEVASGPGGAGARFTVGFTPRGVA